MNNIIQLNDHQGSYTLQINHSEEFYEAAQAVDHLLGRLPVLQAQRDELAQAVIACVKLAKRDGFFTGMKAGTEFAKDMAEGKLDS